MRSHSSPPSHHPWQTGRGNAQPPKCLPNPRSPCSRRAGLQLNGSHTTHTEDLSISRESLSLGMPNLLHPVGTFVRFPMGPMQSTPAPCRLQSGRKAQEGVSWLPSTRSRGASQSRPRCCSLPFPQLLQRSALARISGAPMVLMVCLTQTHPAIADLTVDVIVG